MNFAILRVAKLKNIGALAASGQHNFRERDTKNADGHRTPLNQLAGAASARELVQGVSDLLPAKRRKDAVIALEYLVTASPEHFGPDWRERENFGIEYFNDALKWLQQRHGAENVVCATVHLDESTPHLVAYVVPKTKDGRLAAKDFVGGRAVLTKMQTEFAKEVGQPHGLARGIEKSGAVHHDNASIKAMTAERLTLRQKVKELEAEIDRLTKRVASGDSALAKAEKKAEHQQELNVDNFREINRLTAELKASQAAEAALRAQLAQKAPAKASATPRVKAQIEKQPEAPQEALQPSVEIAPAGIKLAGDGVHLGKVLSVENGYMVQSTGPRTPPVAHRIAELGLAKIPEIGQTVEIHRKGERVHVMGRAATNRGGRG